MFLGVGRERTASHKSILLGVTSPETASFFLLDELRLLSKSGWQTSLVTGKPMPESVQSDLTLGHSVRCHVVPMTRSPLLISDLRALRRWFQVLARINPSVVVIGTPKAAFLGLFAAWIIGIPKRIYFVHGLRFEGFVGWARVATRLIEKVTCSLATNVVCVSHSVQKVLESQKITHSAKLVLTGFGSASGVDLTDFRPVSSPLRAEARKGLGIPLDKPVIGFAGRLVRDKGVLDLVEAVKIVLREVPDTILLIAGDHDGNPRETVSIERALSFPFCARLGQLENMEVFYHAIDIFCLPSVREGMPTVNLEASACGIPVITTHATGTVDSIIDGQTGILVEQGSPLSLGAKIAYLLRLPEERSRMGKLGRQHIEERFDKNLVLRWRESFYWSLLDNSPEAR